MLTRVGRHVSHSTRRITTQRRDYHVPVGLLEDLTHRGFVQDVTRPDALRNALSSRRQVVYAGVDPTATSLHIGHLIPFMTLLHFQIRGHQIIPLIGGATGRIGDPSGRILERQLADVKQVEDNVISLTKSIQNFFKRALVYADARLEKNEVICTEPAVTSNLEWHQSFNMLDFLQIVGVHARVNTMLNRESVRARLNAQHGLSFTEFTYQLLQAYDFYHLHKHFNCSIQVGGSDQWGNILAGLELIGRLDQPSAKEETEHAQAYGITTPLLTTATGEKFGKSAGNAVWLDPNLTSVFDFYQYFMKVADADVEKYMKLFTLLSWSQIQDILQVHSQSPEKRIAQRRLAAEVTELVHRPEGVVRAETLTKLLFESDYSDLKAENIIAAFQGDPRLVMVDKSELLELPVAKLASKHSLVASNSAARSLVTSKGLYLNNTPVPELQFKITAERLINERIAIVRAGKDKLLVLASA
ncbi:hypothetical protein BDQ12DRAFT_673472 [Crucibulum laeve]|uniref:Tyrosine--tRNA ligase n=1 Tax=Crucibulum laeve TaxID=68775 RepID=A0A5C3MHS6_9AGAR|nr:hypothetical protein BDQ12DRAFT_673472 [Crucibulum laeve]